MFETTNFWDKASLKCVKVHKNTVACLTLKITIMYLNLFFCLHLWEKIWPVNEFFFFLSNKARWKFSQIICLIDSVTIVLCRYNFLSLLWENIFLLWVTCFSVKEGSKVCWERGHNLETEGREVADLFRDTAFDPEWNWKTSNKHPRKMFEHWKFRKL